MSEKEELPSTSKSTGAAAATSDNHQRVGSSDEGKNSSSGEVDLRFKQDIQDLPICSFPPPMPTEPGLVPAMIGI